MSLTPEYEVEKLETHAIKPGLKNLLRSIGQSPVGGPLPRIGRVAGSSQIEIPHFVGAPTQERVDHVDPEVGFGERVIVYTQGKADGDYK